ncbi:MAG: SufD family Fe-S cluster assembly protein, partial [Methanomassiliicoccaceae archaeon]|nr:SufD family Fe-S cluster assembly protein [Methanomassiliicoccaceae archaeon]
MPKDKEVRGALDKKAGYGPDIDLSEYIVSDYEPKRIDGIEKAPEEMKERMVNVGVTPCKKGRAGTMLFIGNGPSYSESFSDGLELM